MRVFCRVSMKQQEYLYELVQSLSKSEKRYFKLHSNLVAGSKSYITLFEKLETMRDYDDDRLAKRAKIEKKKLSVSKNYLTEQVLRSLRNFHSSISMRSRIHALLLNVEILYRKGLILPSFKELKKARSLATKHEKFGLLQEILNWERQFSALGEKGVKSEMEIAEEENAILEMQRNVLRYQSLNARLNEIKQEYGYIRGKKERELTEEIINDPLLQNIDQALSVRARYYYHNCYCTYYYLLGSFDKCYEASLDLLNLQPSSPLDESEMMNAMLNHVSSCYFVNHFDESLAAIDHANQLTEELTIGKYEQVQTQVFFFSTYYKNPILVKTGNIKAIEKSIKEDEERYLHYRDLLSSERNSIFQEMLALSYLVIGNYKRSLYWSNQLLYAGNKKIRHDVYVAVRVMNLLALIELQDHQTLSYAANSAYRSIKMLNRADQSFEVELEIVKHMKRAPGYAHRKAMVDWAEKLKSTMTSMFAGGDHESNEFSYFLQWLESIITNEPLSKIVEESGMPMSPK